MARAAAGIGLRLCLWGCAVNGPVGTVNGRVPSRFKGPALTLVENSTQESYPRTYKVKRGDTLWSLARRFGTTVQRLMEINRIDKPERVLAGTYLKIPRPQHVAPGGGSLRREADPARKPAPPP